MPHHASKPSTSKQYEARIRECFRRWPDAAPFYETLIEYLNTALSPGFSQLQIPTIYWLGHDLGQSDPVETGSPLGHSPSSTPPARRFSFPLATQAPGANAQWMRPAPQSHLTVTEGLLAPESIGILGEMYQIRPEFFIDHLELNNDTHTPNARKGRYALPNLPSRRDNIIHVRFMLMLQVSSEAHPFSTAPASRLERRIKLEDKRRVYEQRLFGLRHYGATRIRALHVHTERWLTVEQLVSFSVKREGKNWHGLLLVDGGRESDRVDPPWAEYVRPGDPNAGFAPVVPYNLPIMGNGGAGPQDGRRVQPKQHRPYHPAMDILLAVSSPGHEAQLLAEDPFYILSRIYHEAARTRIQLLNFIESDIIECSAANSRSASRDLQQSRAVDQLLFNLQLIRRVERFCKEDLGSIARLGSASWPRTERLAEMEQIQRELQGDYDYLIERCGSLALQCQAASNALVGLAQWMDAQDGIRESRNLADLTFLAFLFIPLNYISSCLSMNVTGIAEGVSVWVWGATSAISVLVTGIVVIVFRRWRSLLRVGTYLPTTSPILGRYFSPRAYQG
ncbi:Magnesium transport protein CorA [Madurella fahalii]|uniref:Magnesium transport protein CorA n=1 Tax=Madurella fahalii TaxID=1157608 RepID=A0ABQ0GNH8_9PEZI